MHGVGLDNETGKQVNEPGACGSETRAKERPWDTASSSVKPTFRFFYHEDDGVHDRSCAEKAIERLRSHGYPEAPPLILKGEGRRHLLHHFWQDAYNLPILEFFQSFTKTP